MDDIVIGVFELKEIEWDLRKLSEYLATAGEPAVAIRCLSQVQNSIADLIAGRTRTYRNMNAALLSRDDSDE